MLSKDRRAQSSTKGATNTTHVSINAVPKVESSTKANSFRTPPSCGHYYHVRWGQDEGQGQGRGPPDSHCGRRETQSLGIAKIKPAVEDLLVRHKANFVLGEPNEGCVTVRYDGYKETWWEYLTGWVPSTCVVS